MDEPQRYAVMTTGSLVPDFSASAAGLAVATLFSLPADQASALVGQRRIVRKDLSLTAARQLQQRLARAGLCAELIEQTCMAPTASGEGPARFEARDIPAPVANVRAPLTGTLHAAATPTHGDASGGACAATGEPTGQALPPRLAPLGLLACAGVAVAATQIWMAYAIHVGAGAWLLAIAIGAAAGHAMHQGGSRGNLAGLTSATAAALSVAIGNYLLINHVLGGVTNMRDAETMASLRQAYREEVRLAQDYVHARANPDTLRQFLVLHDYASTEYPDLIEDEEIRRFHAQTGAQLEWLADRPGLNSWYFRKYGEDINTPSFGDRARLALITFPVLGMVLAGFYGWRLGRGDRPASLWPFSWLARLGAAGPDKG